MATAGDGNRYRVTGVLGAGAFGSVYAGEAIGGGITRRVALKLLHANVEGRGELERRLRDEARMLSLIHHRAIVRVEDLTLVDGAWCVVMEHVDGEDLGGLLALGPLPARAALQVAEEVASALHAAWSQPGPSGPPLALIHRDIKPQNIRITPHGEVKLLDFGVARADFGEREAATRGVGFGTLIYMAPERYNGVDSHAGDVYALGVTLFQLLTGRPPGASAADADRRPPGRKLTAEWASLDALSPGLRDLIANTLDEDAAARPSARDCARRLADLRVQALGEPLEDWIRPALTRIAQQAGRVLPPADAASGSGTLRIGQTIGGASPTTERRGAMMPWGLLLGLLGLLGAGGGALGVGGWAFWSALHPVPALIGADPAPEPASTPAPTPTVPLAATPRPAPSSPAPGTTAPKPAPAPPPEVAPRTPESAPVARGVVTVSGTVKEVRLFRGGASASPGSVPAGSYFATATFATGATVQVREVVVAGGKTTRIRCEETFATCTVTPPE